MKDYDFKGVVQAISDASPSHLALVSFLVLPIVMNYWLETLIKAFPEISSCWKLISLSLLVIIYLCCLWWLSKENSKRKRLELQKDQIIGRLISKGFTNVGFDSARKALTSKVSDEELIEIIETFPKSLRYVRLKKKDANGNFEKDDSGKQGYKPGVGLVSIKDENDEDDT